MKTATPSPSTSSTSASPALPPAIAWLGYGGALPFVALAAATWLVPDWRTLAYQALLGYGAVILSFVGALHWGVAMVAPAPALSDTARTRAFAWSVVPALVAWTALLLPGAAAGWLVVGGFIAHYLQDLRLARQTAALPAWYLRLRLHLSSFACLSLAAGSLAVGSA